MSRSDVNDLVASSGNNFHAKAARWLRDDNWKISVSPYYLDQQQQKARELDLVAEKRWQTMDRIGRPSGAVYTRLFIECKFVPADTVFWLRNKDPQEVEQIICAGGKFRPQNTYTNRHHYFDSAQRAACLFASKKGADMESEPFFKGLNQVLNGYVFFRNSTPQLARESSYDPFQIYLDYQVIVCNSFEKMYAVDFDVPGDAEVISQPFILDVQYAFQGKGGARSENLLIDVVDFASLPAFTEMIGEDATIAGHFARVD